MAFVAKAARLADTALRVALVDTVKLGVVWATTTAVLKLDVTLTATVYGNTFDGTTWVTLCVVPTAMRYGCTADTTVWVPKLEVTPTITTGTVTNELVVTATVMLYGSCAVAYATDSKLDVTFTATLSGRIDPVGMYRHHRLVYGTGRYTKVDLYFTL